MRAALKLVVYLLSTLSLVLIMTATVVLVRFDYFARLVSDRILANAIQPSAREMPQTTGPINYSSSYLTVLGGRGEGLSCSLPELAQRLAFPAQVNRQSIGLQMRQACAAHDYCYRHGAATYNYTQAECDYRLQEDAFRLCLFIENANVLEGRDRRKQSKCLQDARLVTLGVRVGGSDSFRTSDPTMYSSKSTSALESNQVASTYFEYEQYPGGSKKYTLFRLVRQSSAGKITASVFKFDTTPRGTFVFSADIGDRPTEYKRGPLLLGRPQYIPSIPQVVRVGSTQDWEDWLVWWQRYNLDSTGGRLVGIAPQRATEEDWRCLDTFPSEGSKRIDASPECIDRDTWFVALVGTENHDDDNNFSEIQPAHDVNRPGPTVRMIALGTHSCIKGDRGNAPCFVDLAVKLPEAGDRNALGAEELFQPQEPLRVTDRLAPSIAGMRQTENDRYRNYVSLPFVLHPRGTGKNTLMWIRRDGEDYASFATVRRLQSTDALEPERPTGISKGTVRLKNVTELDEPFFLLGQTRENPILVSLTSKAENPIVSGVTVSEWQLPSFLPPDKRDQDIVPVEVDKIENRCRPSIDSGWLARPPVVYELASGGAEVVFSRLGQADSGLSTAVLQIASLEIDADGVCGRSVDGFTELRVEELIPEIDSSGDSESQLFRRLRALRETPLLVDDLNGDGTPEVVFPGAGHKPNVRMIALPKKR